MKIYDRLKEWGMMLPELVPTNGFLRVKLIDGFAFISQGMRRLTMGVSLYWATRPGVRSFRRPRWREVGHARMPGFA